MELIKLSTVLGIAVVEKLKEKGVEPRKNKYGILSLEFTKEELEMVTEIKLYCPKPGCLKGLEYCKNLEKLEITSPYNEYEKQNPSIDDSDIKIISNLTSLKSLIISNQSNISWVYLDKLVNLEELSITRNANIDLVSGLENLKKIRELEIYGNVELYDLPHIVDLIESNELDYLALDLLNYPEVSEIAGKLSKITSCYFMETVTSKKDVSYLRGAVSIFHGKCLRILSELLENCHDKKEMIILIERYLAENVTYDYEGRKLEKRYHVIDGKKVGNNNNASNIKQKSIL